jgi:hypothetical protein
MFAMNWRKKFQSEAKAALSAENVMHAFCSHLRQVILSNFHASEKHEREREREKERERENIEREKENLRAEIFSKILKVRKIIVSCLQSDSTLAPRWLVCGFCDLKHCPLSCVSLAKYFLNKFKS